MFKTAMLTMTCPNCDDIEMDRTSSDTHVCGSCGWTEYR
jgi:ribosomal protein L37AE/L43A